MNRNMLINVSKRFNIPSTIDFPTKMLASLQIDKTGTVIIVRDHPDFHSSKEQIKLADQIGTVVIVRDHPDFHSSKEQIKLGRL